MSNKILFIDDQEEILDLIKLRLASENYEKIFTHKVDEALQILENDKIDVLVTDIFMPELGGLDLLQILKEKYPWIVRVVLSGFSQVNTVLEAVNKGDIYRFITKPWRVDEAGKQILRDALSYSEFVKKSYLKNEEEITKISVLREILDIKQINYEITHSDGENCIKLNDKMYIKLQ